MSIASRLESTPDALRLAAPRKPSREGLHLDEQAARVPLIVGQTTEPAWVGSLQSGDAAPVGDLARPVSPISKRPISGGAEAVLHAARTRCAWWRSPSK